MRRPTILPPEDTDEPDQWDDDGLAHVVAIGLLVAAWAMMAIVVSTAVALLPFAVFS